MLSDIDISGNVIVNFPPVNTTVMLNRKPLWDVERDIKDTMLAIRFKHMLHDYDIQSRAAILERCVEWAENFQPADEATLTWFRHVSTLNFTDLLNVGIIWEQLYKNVCHQDCFKKVAMIFFLNT